MGIIDVDSHTVFRCDRWHIERYGPSWDERRLALHAVRRRQFVLDTQKRCRHQFSGPQRSAAPLVWPPVPS